MIKIPTEYRNKMVRMEGSGEITRVITFTNVRPVMQYYPHGILEGMTGHIWEMSNPDKSDPFKVKYQRTSFGNMWDCPATERI